MEFSTGDILLIISLLLFISCVSSGLSFKYGVPAVLIFLGVGMAAGTDGLGIQFSNPKIAEFIGIVSLCFILFSGGLSTKWKIVRPVVGQSILLASLGVLLTAAALGLFIYLLIPYMDIRISLLIGAICSSTDAAAVFSILRSNNTNLSPRLLNTLEFESAANDPMAYMLTITMIGIINEETTTVVGIVFLLFKQITIGLALAYVMGKAMVLLLNRLKLASDGLYPVLLMALNLLTFAIADKLGGNGFLAVYISGLILGNNKFLYKKTLTNYYEGQSNLWQIVLFITLGLLVNPSQIPSIAPIGIAIAILLMFFARPAAVLICSIFISKDKISFREKLFIAWAGIRGASSIVFATMPLVYISASSAFNKEQQLVIFHIVFFISIFSVIIQGTTLERFARWLKLKTVRSSNVTYSFVEIDGRKSSLTMRVCMTDNAAAVGKEIKSLDFSPNVLLTTIMREGKYIIPHGDTVIRGDDEILISVETPQDIEIVKHILGVEEEDI